ncbi:PSAP [Lepeophtheirus salmonis]|uniref:PSAP n=1 Tax=Lepeophtheirus salmonis TaxID=72036 RepID=A0A7R8CSE4_LEPSM|nr:PSAP [Lepeophtheirus salmonis]CAF2916125.1 PSAP [Lepeophtheirus salmonis]
MGITILLKLIPLLTLLALLLWMSVSANPLREDYVERNPLYEVGVIPDSQLKSVGYNIQNEGFRHLLKREANPFLGKILQYLSKGKYNKPRQNGGFDKTNRKIVYGSVTFINLRFLVLLALVVIASAATVSKDQMIEKSIKCDLCKYLITKVNESVLTQDNADQVIEKVEEICAQAQEVSSFLGETCTSFVNDVLKPRIEDLLSAKQEPEKVCKELEMC